jgi:hypothetical protein
MDRPSSTYASNLYTFSSTLYPTRSQICWGRWVTKFYSSAKAFDLFTYGEIEWNGLKHYTACGSLDHQPPPPPPSCSMNLVQGIASTANKIWTQQVMGETADLHLSSSYSAHPKMCNVRVPHYISVMPVLVTFTPHCVYIHLTNNSINFYVN